jgi:hypothetical protein
MIDHLSQYINDFVLSMLCCIEERRELINFTAIVSSSEQVFLERSLD